MFILHIFVFCSQVLFNQFKYFYNLYFLLLACSQFIKELRLGALYTYWVPLVSTALCPILAHCHDQSFVSYCAVFNPLTQLFLFPLQGFVLIITIIREAVEEIRCYVRDKEVNSQIYSKLSSRGNTLMSVIPEAPPPYMLTHSKSPAVGSDSESATQPGVNDEKIQKH